MKKTKKSAKDTPSSGSSRYWSLMLVGDHGRVIAIRHIKGVFMALCLALILALLAAVALGTLYFRERRATLQKQDELSALQSKIGTLKHEKDLLMAKLVVAQTREKTASQPAAPPTVADKTPVAARPAPPSGTPPASKKAESPVAKKPPADKTAAMPVRLSVDIEKFKVSYKLDTKTLAARFRIRNTTPKKGVPVTGRIVVVFKRKDGPPIHWLPVPRVQLIDGEPSGRRGQIFKINNYRTVEFKAINQKAPVTFDTVSIYVFDRHGEQLLRKDKPIDLPAVVPVVPVPKASAAPKAKPAATPAAEPSPKPVQQDKAVVGDPAAPVQKPPETPPQPAGQIDSRKEKTAPSAVSPDVVPTPDNLQPAEGAASDTAVETREAAKKPASARAR